MEKFERLTNGFNFIFERELKANETVILQMPAVSANKRSINDIGWQTNGDVTFFGTLSRKPKSANALWQPIEENVEVNKAVSAIKIVNHGGACRVVVRAILN